jgi:chemotaxis protein CheX
MNTKSAEPFISSFMNVMPQLGFSDVQRGSIEEVEKKIESPGVIVIIGVVGDLRGNVIYGMSEEYAKKIASTMMMGMEVAEFDEMAQSAISELSNMLTATASTEFTSLGIKTDISTPTLMYGEFTACASFEHVIRLELFAEGLPFYIYVSLE